VGLDFAAIWTAPYSTWLLEGVRVTLRLTGIGIVGSTILALVLVLMRMSGQKIASKISGGFVHFFRNTPFPVQILFWYFGFPAILPQSLQARLYAGDFEFTAAVFALILYSGAYIAEHFRSGIASIPKSQMESALSSGLTYMQSMRYVILPQAFRISLPPLISEYLSIAKNSSVAMTIGVAELTAMSRQVESYSFRAFESFMIASAVYLSLSLLTSVLLNWYNKRFLAARPS
jgi:polar amino acid transport system permease protein